MIGYKKFFKNGSRDPDHSPFGVICHLWARTCCA